MNTDFAYAEDSAAAPPCLPGHKHHFHQMAAGGEAHFNQNTPHMCCNCWATFGVDKEGIGHFPVENTRRAAREGAAALRDIADHLRKDAQRYRYMRNTAPWNCKVAVVDAVDMLDDTVFLCKEELDAAIDAALSSTGKP